MTRPSITFDEHGWASRRLPRQCVRDCSHAGACDSDVEHWATRLDFYTALEPHIDKARVYLAEYGAWDDLDTADIVTLAERVLWIAANDEAEGTEWLGLVH